jgi:hypothetical protein
LIACGASREIGRKSRINQIKNPTNCFSSGNEGTSNLYIKYNVLFVFRVQSKFIAIRQAIGTVLKKRWGEQAVSWGHIVQVLLNGIPFAIGSASIILILLQYVLLGFMLMNLFVLIMIRSDKRKSQQQRVQKQLLKE